MIYDVIVLLALLTLVVTVIAIITKNVFFKVASGSMFIILGLLILINGVDVQTGVNTVCTSVLDNATCEIANETAVFDNTNDLYTQGFGLISIFIGLFVFLSSVVFGNDDD